MKTCTCCKKAYTDEQWDALALLGSQFYDDDAGQWWRLDLKNCECHGTMAIKNPIAAPKPEGC